MSSRSRVCYLHKSFPFPEKRPRWPETGIKDGFEEMEHEFLFGKFRPEMQANLVRCLLRQSFLSERPKKSCTMILYFPNGFSGNFFQTVNSYYLKVSLGTIHKVFNVSISQRSYLSMTSTREQRLF